MCRYQLHLKDFFKYIRQHFLSSSKSSTFEMKSFVKFRFIQLFLIFSLFSLQSNSSVWQEQNQWNEDYEKQFSQWIEQVPVNIFIAGQWGPMPTDCADAVYYLRAIFSFENQLPFVMHRYDSDKLLTNQMNNFDHIKNPLKRVKKFLTEAVYIYGNVDTLAQDSYPVAIQRSTIIPGTLWLRFPAHVEYVRQVLPSGVVGLIGSTKPLEVRQLIIKSDLFAKPIDPKKHGFRKFKWPQQMVMFEQSLPGYSYEQYEIGGRGQNDDDDLDNFNRLSILWKRQIEKRLAYEIEDQEALAKRVMGNLCQQIRIREKIVSETQIKKQEKNTCFNLLEYDDLSTPTRDEIIFTSVQELLKARRVLALTNQRKVNAITDLLSTCEDIRLDEQRNVKVSDFILNILYRDVSSNPNHSVDARWGIKSGIMENNCPDEKALKEEALNK